MVLSLFFSHAMTTHGITVRVAPRFLPEQSDPDNGRFVWSYHVRVENGTNADVQLLRRHWLITDGTGQVSEVEGEGVVGEQPVIAPGASFDYVSGCPLPTPEGRMDGSYLMAGPQGQFRVTIPGFVLEQPAAGAD